MANALELIKKEKQERTGYLDLGKCGLTEWPDLRGMYWLHTLILSNRWVDRQQRRWVESQNQGQPNRLKTPPTNPLPAKINHVILQELGISKASFLKELKGLTSLDISDNQISDASFLKELKGLTSLDISDNQISDASFLNELKGLTYLDISDNHISDASFLWELNELTYLDIRSNKISEAGFLKELKGLNYLYISSNQISDSSFLKELKGLTSLDIRSNKISDASSLKELKELNSLNISSNQISDASFLKELKGLNYLNISDNKINDASFLKELKKLTSLNISDNQISDASFLKELKGLTSLNIRSNQIRDTSFLKELKALNYLDIRDNQISDASFLKELKRLTSLDISKNKISDAGFLMELKELTSLDISKNQISDASFLKELKRPTYLDLSYNQISDFSPGWHLIEKGIPVVWDYLVRDKICVLGNPFTTPPVEVMKLGNEAILRYFEELERSGSVRLMETRMLIVGQGNAGKTSLKTKLHNVYDPLPTREDTTRGILISSLPCKTAKGEDFTINIWDFGGQNIQHYAHQFFLSGSSLYVLVHNQRQQNTNFLYWLNIIEMLGQKSPVIILQNKDTGHAEPIENAASIRDRYQNVLSPFYMVDLSKAAEEDQFEELKKAIATIASDPKWLPHFGTTRPKSFVLVKNELVEWAKSKQFISYNHFKHICGEYGVDDPLLVKDYSETFTFLGTCLHFPNDLLLKDFVFLRPKWIIDALFKLLYDDKVEKTGQFSEMETNSIWPEEEYGTMRLHLIRLMENFKLCYAVKDCSEDDKRYVVPQRLPQVKDSFPWEPADVVRVIYRYKFKPEGLLTRLICNLHSLIEDDHVWSDAVIFKKKGLGRVFVRERYGEEEIWIEATGPKRSDLLNRVVEKLEAIHAESKFENLRWEQLAPCDCPYCQRPSNEPYLHNCQTLVEFLNDDIREERCPYGWKEGKYFINIRAFLARIFENGEEPPYYLKEHIRESKDHWRNSEENDKQILRQLNDYNDLLKELVIQSGNHAEDLNKLFGLLESTNEPIDIFERIDKMMEERLKSVINQLPQTDELVLKFKAATAKTPNDIDVKQKIKMKMALVFGVIPVPSFEMETEVAHNINEIWKSTRSDLLAINDGKKKWHELFWKAA